MSAKTIDDMPARHRRVIELLMDRMVDISQRLHDEFATHVDVTIVVNVLPGPGICVSTTPNHERAVAVLLSNGQCGDKGEIDIPEPGKPLN
jgi:hypothetical protein